MAGFDTIEPVGGGAFNAASQWGYEQAEACRTNGNLLFFPMFLGGSRSVGVQMDVATDPNIDDWIDLELDGDLLANMIVRLRAEMRTSDSGTTVKVDLWDVTTGTHVKVSTGALACASTTADYSGTNQTQRLDVTLAAGRRKYRAKLTISTLGVPVYAIAYLEIYAPPAAA